jgi:hypothetical protein
MNKKDDMHQMPHDFDALYLRFPESSFMELSVSKKKIMILLFFLNPPQMKGYLSLENERT